MNKKLAIRGHLTRGLQVVKILEALGGKSSVLGGNNPNYIYYIDPSDGYILVKDINNSDPKEFAIFTLEEFIKNYPYKVGDKVQEKGSAYYDTVYIIESMAWENSQIVYTVYNQHHQYPKCIITTDHIQFCQEEPKKQRKYPELRMDPSDDDKLATEVIWDNHKILPPSGYLIGKITEVDDGLLVEFAKKRPQENDSMDLTEILKNVLKGTILYSTTHGNIRFDGIDPDDKLYPIKCHGIHGIGLGFTKEGRWHHNYQGECVLFPSKEQRHWNKFELTKTEK